VLGQTREQDGHAGYVAVVLAGLVCAAEVDVLDLLGRHAGTVDRFPDDERRQIVRPDPGQRSAVPPDRRSHAGDDHRPTHAWSLTSTRLTVSRSSAPVLG
jgi:hypothetical protein